MTTMVIAIGIIIAAIVGFLFQYLIIKAAVKNGYLEAIGTINMARKQKPQTREEARAEDNAYYQK